jgi:hypothetical protein
MIAPATSTLNCSFLRARRTGFYQGVGAPTAPPLRGSGPSLCLSPMPQVRGAKLERRECRLGRVILSALPRLTTLRSINGRHALPRPDQNRCHRRI